MTAFSRISQRVQVGYHPYISERKSPQPVLVMAGRNSKIAPQEQMATMSRQLPHARLVPFDGYGQGIAFSAPKRCVAEMRAFLQSLPATA